MLRSTLLSPLLTFLFLTSTTAVPHNYAQSPNPLSSRQDCDRAGVYICKDINWGGECINYWECLGGDHCIQLDAQASAIGPQEGITCRFYTNAFCDDLGQQTLSLGYPGNGDLTTTPGWNDNIRSYHCFRV